MYEMFSFALCKLHRDFKHRVRTASKLEQQELESIKSNAEEAKTILSDWMWICPDCQAREIKTPSRQGIRVQRSQMGRIAEEAASAGTIRGQILANDPSKSTWCQTSPNVSELWMLHFGDQILTNSSAKPIRKFDEPVKQPLI